MKATFTATEAGQQQADIETHLARLTRLTADFLYLQGHSFRPGEAKPKADPIRAQQVLQALAREVEECEAFVGIDPPGVRA